MYKIDKLTYGFEVVESLEFVMVLVIVVRCGSWRRPNRFVFVIDRHSNGNSSTTNFVNRHQRLPFRCTAIMQHSRNFK